MDLRDVYSNQVSKHRVNISGSTNTGGVTKQRDPAIQKLENNVSTHMNDIIQQTKKAETEQAVADDPGPVKEVDLAQALKEFSGIS